MFKKLLYKLIFLTIIYNLFIYNSFADLTCESSCKIKSNSPKIILDYIKNNGKIISNINSEISKQKSEKEFNISTGIQINGTNIKGSRNISTGIVYRIYNSLFNWNEVESGFSFFMSSINLSLSYPIRRDFEKINSQNEKLNNLLVKVITQRYVFVKLDGKKICEGVEDNGKCEKTFSGEFFIEDIIKKLINNNNNINYILRRELGIISEKISSLDNKYDELFLVPEKFKNKLKENYNKNTSYSCAKCSGGTIDKINKSIDKIILNDKAGKDGIQEWKDAYNLVFGLDTEEKINKERKIERNLLKKELNRQGVSSNNGDAMLKNLENFNNKDTGFSINNNPISNTFTNLVGTLKKNYTKFSDIIVSEFSDSTKLSLDLGSIVKTRENLENEQEIISRVDGIIQKNYSIISRQNQNSDKLQGRIISLHFNLLESINKIEKIIPKAEKICQDQDKKRGKCTFR